jgi:hypothetical protein
VRPLSENQKNLISRCAKKIRAKRNILGSRFITVGRTVIFVPEKNDLVSAFVGRFAQYHYHHLVAVFTSSHARLESS